MKYKKTLSVFLLVSMLVVSGSTAFATTGNSLETTEGFEEVMPISEEIEKDEQAYYDYYTGLVKEINDFHAREGSKIISLESEENGPANLVISEDTYIVGDEEITLGSTITGFYKANEPMILIYPPQYNVKVLAVNNKNYNIKVDRFDENLVSADNMLKLNVSEETEIILEDGKVFDGNIENANLVVIYDISTRSIPAQTIPIKIIVLFEEKIQYQNLTLEELEDLIGDIATLDIMVNNTKIDAPTAYLNKDRIEMVPLRAIAEAIGFEVEWDGETQGISLGKNISLKIGEDRYDYTKKIPVKLGTAPELVDSTTYVPLRFFKEIVDMNNAYIFEGQIVINNEEEMK